MTTTWSVGFPSQNGKCEEVAARYLLGWVLFCATWWVVGHENTWRWM